MKKQIRQGVFETNSSSTHSICIAKDAQLEIPKELRFEFGEFGWESNTLNSLWEKASYLYTGLIANERKDDAKNIFEILESKGIEVTFEEPDGGYVDHSDKLTPFLDAICSDEAKLMNFLFSPLSFIITSNDNGGDSPDFTVSYEYDEYYKGN